MGIFGNLVENAIKDIAGNNSTAAKLAESVLGGLQSQQGGGLGALVSQLSARGLAEHVQSWIGNGPNKPVTPDQLRQGLDPKWLQELASRAGIPVEAVTQHLSELLPKIVDHLTPNGRLPDAPAVLPGATVTSPTAGGGDFSDPAAPPAK